MATDMKQTLEGLGWKMYYECIVCKGKKQFFNHVDHKGYEIVTRPMKNIFSIGLNNQIIGGPFYGYQVAEKLTAFIK